MKLGSPAELWVGVEGWEREDETSSGGSRDRACGSRGGRRGAPRRRRKRRRGAGRRVAVTQGGRFKPKEGNAAAPREPGVGVAIAGHPWGRGGGSCPALPAAAA